MRMTLQECGRVEIGGAVSAYNGERNNRKSAGGPAQIRISASLTHPHQSRQCAATERAMKHNVVLARSASAELHRGMLCAGG